MMSFTLRRGWRLRQIELSLSLLVLAVCSGIFLAWPSLDLQVSAWFVGQDGRFLGNDYAAVRWVHGTVPWLGRGAALVGAVVAWSLWRRPAVLGVRWWRRSMVLALGMLLVVGLLVNGLLKEGWGRARPVAVQQFGGSARFVPAWVISRECERNCSFVSGHAATGYLLMMVGSLGSPWVRRRWLVIGMATGLALGLLRVSQGGHFASDVLIAGALVWAASCLQRALWLRWPRWRRRRQPQPALLEAS